MFFVTTHNQKRLNTWLSLFGVDKLPVKVGRPRFQIIKGRGRTLAFDLDAAGLTPHQFSRFSAYIARNARIPYADARDTVDGFPIPAAGLIVLGGKKTPIR